LARRLPDWLTAFNKYTSNTEAPEYMHSWAGVSAIAGCLRRKVWLDMRSFQWTPNFYIIFVAPPGVVSKSTTADLAADLLKKVPGIKFGPDVVTWPALVEAFAAAGEAFQYEESWMPMSAITLVASELGNLINPQDRDQINLYINLWDGRKSLEKVTKMSGNATVEAPWINLIGCTTPHWIADNMPIATVGGGFTSRCIWIYADRKERLIAYPDEQIVNDYDQLKLDLINDLEHIATQLCGPFTLTKDGREWGRNWYTKHWGTRAGHLESEKLDGYIARKQTHLHKLAMVISASNRDDLTLDVEDLTIADAMLSAMEKDLDKVFSRIGKSETSMIIDRFLEILRRRTIVPWEEAYRMVHTTFPNFKEYESMVQGLINSGYVKLQTAGGKMALEYVYSGKPGESVL
jgi:hypothetical protein